MSEQVHCKACEGGGDLDYDDEGKAFWRYPCPGLPDYAALVTSLAAALDMIRCFDCGHNLQESSPHCSYCRPLRAALAAAPKEPTP